MVATQALAVVHWGSANGALGVITFPGFLASCDTLLCRRQVLASALVLPMGALSIADTAVLLSARLNGQHLLPILFGHH
jgi:hypothetical protein